jgi:hypothetical protein
VAVVLLLVGLGAGFAAGDYLSMPSEVTMPSDVTISGLVDAFNLNVTGIGAGAGTSYNPTTVEFFYYHCHYSATAVCESQYNSTVSAGAAYSVTVPNGHLYYVAVWGSEVNTEACYGGGTNFPVYSYASSVNYNITAVFYCH